MGANKNQTAAQARACRVSGDSTGIKLSSDRGNAPARRVSGPGQASLTLELPAAGATCPFTAYANHLVQFQTLASLSNLGGTLLQHPPPANKHGHTPFLNLSCSQSHFSSSY